MRARSPGPSLPLSMETYRRTKSEQRRHTEEQDAYNDGTCAGFVLGALGAMVVWLVLSGVVAEGFRILLRAAMAALGGGA